MASNEIRKLNKNSMKVDQTEIKTGKYIYLWTEKSRLTLTHSIMKQKRNLRDVTNIKNNFPNTYFTTFTTLKQKKTDWET